MARVLIVYGSEFGTTQQIAEAMCKKWSGSKERIFELAPQPLSGNAAAGQFSSLKDNFDALVILTSSHGDGDPPDNFVKFLRELTAANENGSTPLAGMKHSVLGLGDSSYDTFQNCPRITDKLMEECGSCRIHKRFELDNGLYKDADMERMQSLEKRWEKEVFDVLQSNLNGITGPVCQWPEHNEDGNHDYIFPKSLKDLGGDETGSGGMSVIIGFGALVAAGAGLYFYYSGSSPEAK